jgi:hypothetical protein
MRSEDGYDATEEPYSPECVEGRFCEVGLPFEDVMRSSSGFVRPWFRPLPSKGRKRKRCILPVLRGERSV